jgi:CelD/BcsL family acetyltransferase involved in cellulose biosynthesis
MKSVTEKTELRREDSSGWNDGLQGTFPFHESSGVLARYEFIKILDRVMVPDSAKRFIWSIESEQRHFYLPCFLETKSSAIFSWTLLRQISDLYPGRSESALLMTDSAASSALYDKAFAMHESWDCFSICVLGDGQAELDLLASAERSGFKPVLEESNFYPYIDLPDNWDELYAGFAKKFRYNIRNSEKLLRKQGDLTLDRVTDPDEIERFLDHAFSIERLSWKEAAGTSITKNAHQEDFHSRLAHATASTGIFRGYVLYLDDSPIAHVYGVLLGGIFYSLKLSYSEEYRKYAPGIVVTALALQDLIAEGVKFWDFSGLSEDYKRRWTGKEYCLRMYKFFGKGVRGRLLAVREILRRILPSR